MSRASTFPTGAVDCSSRPAIRETLKAMLALVHPLPSPADHRNVDRPLEINISGLASIPTRAPKPSHRKHSLHYQPESSSAPRTPSASSTVACHSYPARPNAVQSQHPANHQPAYLPPKRPHPSDKQSPRAPQQPASQQTTETVDIHSYAPADLLRLLASLLTQIASTNDALASTDPAHTLSAFSHPISPENTAHTPLWCSLTSASRSSLANPASTLAFHARNIPTIPLEAYLLRILRYCPTTNEVFLALLVYFDRMSRLAHDATGRTFVIDSYNVHRLIIAGVTVASKFFSDVFYTNSRYAKVGGLPQAELNQLELQFLLLNDFRLVISPEEMQRYTEQLILFSRSQQQPLAPPSPLLSSPSSPSSSSSHTYPPNPLLRTPPNAHSSQYAHTGPARAMGAIDAYGGTVAPDRTPNMRAVHVPPSLSSHSTHTFANHSYTNHQNRPANNARDDDASSILSTDTETTETEGGDTTDDEPTIRPPNSGSSCCGDTLEDTMSGQDEGVFQADGTREGGCDSERNELQGKSMPRRVDSPPEIEGDGDRADATPELRAQRRLREISEDIGMASP